MICDAWLTLSLQMVISISFYHQKLGHQLHSRFLWDIILIQTHFYDLLIKPPTLANAKEMTISIPVGRPETSTRFCDMPWFFLDYVGWNAFSYKWMCSSSVELQLNINA